MRLTKLRQALLRGNGGGPDIANSPTFWAPLETSIVNTRGSGSLTFTRATVATVQDWEGCIYNVLSSEARFKGLRRVRNFIAIAQGSEGTNTRSISNVTPTGGQTDVPTGATSSVLWTITNNSWFFHKGDGADAVGIAPAGGIVYRVAMKGVGSSIGKTVFLQGVDGAGAGAIGALTVTLTADWKTFSFATNVASTAGTDIYLNVSSSGATVGLGDAFLATAFQIENVAGQSNQNPSEYVSVAVLSAPYHGANVDGVKYFSTQNGTTVVSNVVTEGTGALIPVATRQGYFAEEATTNLVLQSENFGTTWTTSGTPTRVAAALRCGSVVLDLLGDDDAGVAECFLQSPTFTGDGVKSISYHFAQGTAASSVFRVNDLTAIANRLLAAVTWVNGIPTVTMTTGTLLGVDSLGNGVFRARFLTTAVTAANNNSIQVWPATDAAFAAAATGTIYCGGVQAENRTLDCTSYIPTTTATVTRNIDALTFPAAGNADGTVGTVYCEGTANEGALTGRWLDNVTGLALTRSAGGGNSLTLNDGASHIIGTVGVGAIPTSKRLVSAWSGTTCSGSVDGVVTSGVAFDGDMNFGATFTIGGKATVCVNGCVKNLKIWTTRLSDTAISTLPAAA